MTARRGEGRGPARPAHHDRREARRGRAHRQVRLDRLRDAPARARPRDPAGRGPARRRRVRPDRRLRGLATTAWSRASRRARRSCRSGASRTACRPASSTWAAARPRSSSSSTRRPISTSPRSRRPPAPEAPAGPPPRARRVGGRAQRATTPCPRRPPRRCSRSRTASWAIRGDGRRGRSRARLRAAYVAGLFDGHDGRAGGPGGDRRLGRHARSRSTAAPCAPGSGTSSSTPAGSTCGRCALERTLRCVDPDGRTLRLDSERFVSLADRHVGAIRLELALEDGPEARVARGRRPPHPRERTGRCRTSSWSRPGSVGEHRRPARAHAGQPGRRRPRARGERARRRRDRRRRAHGRRGHVRPGGRVRPRAGRGARDRPVRRGPHRAGGRAARAVGRQRRPIGAGARASTRSSTPTGQPGRRCGTLADVEIEGDQDAQVGVRFAAAELIAAAPTDEQPVVDRREGAHRRRLQGPRLLGHGHLPAAVLRRRQAGDRAPDRRVPRAHARRRPPERRERRPARRVVRLGERGLGRGRHPVVRHRAGRPPSGGADRAPGDPRRRRRRLGDRDVRAHVRRRGASSTPAAARSTAECRALLRDPGGRDARGLEIHDVIGPDELHEHVAKQRLHELRWRRGRCAAPPTWPMPGTPRPSPASPRGGATAADRMVILRTDGRAHRGARGVHGAAAARSAGRAGRSRRARLAARPHGVARRQAGRRRDADGASRAAVRRGRARGAAIACTSRSRATSRRSRRPCTRWSPAAPAWTTRPTTTCDARIAIDLDDSRGNRAEGLHMATQGGLWQAVVLGCAGARALDDGSFRLDPNLPAGWDRSAVPLDPPRNAAHRHRLARRAARRGGRGRRHDHGARLDGRGARGRAAPARRRLRRLARRGLIDLQFLH